MINNETDSDEINYCRNATVDDLKNLIKSFNEHQVEYYLIGGYALFAHGHNRATSDIDFLVPTTIESGEKVKKALMILPDQAAKDIDVNWFIDDETDEDNGNIRVADDIAVDILFKSCGENYDSLKPYLEVIDIDGIKVNTLNLEGLLKTKQTIRSKDIGDRHYLENAIMEKNKLKINKPKLF